MAFEEAEHAGGGRLGAGEDGKARLRRAGELCGVDIHADQRLEAREAAVDIDVVVGGAEFRAEGDDEVGIGKKPAHGLEAGAGRHAQRMAGEHAAGIDGGDDRRADALGKVADFLFRRHRAAAGKDDGAGGIGAEDGGALEGFRIGARACRDGGGETAGLDGCRHHVCRDFDMDRAGAAGKQHGEGAFDHLRQVGGVEKRVRIERQRLHHALLVRQFMQHAAAVAERIAPVDA